MVINKNMPNKTHKSRYSSF